MLQVGISALLISLLIMIILTKSGPIPKSKLETQKLESEIIKLNLEIESLETKINKGKIKSSSNSKSSPNN